MNALYQPIFHAMRHVERLDFASRSGPRSTMNWNHLGSGKVEVTVDGDDIHFVDRFVLENGLHCEDRKCWRFTADGIVFRHFRQQQYQDILLLVPDPERADRLFAHSPFHCPPDDYDGMLLLMDHALVLSLSISGTRKDEHIQYAYRPACDDQTDPADETTPADPLTAGGQSPEKRAAPWHPAYTAGPPVGAPAPRTHSHRHCSLS